MYVSEMNNHLKEGCLRKGEHKFVQSFHHTVFHDSFLHFGQSKGRLCVICVKD